MPEKQGIFNIEKQESGRDLYNVGNLIINPIAHELVYIPSIQSVLRKDEIKAGKFFRTEAAWVDFEQDFIVERKEVDDIINKLENNKVQLILGAPASGKSIILKNVGYELANAGKKVHVVELKKHPVDEIKLFFENIPKIDNRSIFIVDDAHLYLSYCERLAKDFKSKGKGNLIIGSREPKEITEEHPKEGMKYELLSELSKTCIHVQAEDVTINIIRRFLEKQYHFDEDRIQILSSDINRYKNDLWLLSWALKAYNKDKESVNDDEIYDKIACSIEKIIVGKDREPINAAEVLLPLSIFYKFEIPIERYFLEEQLGVDGKIINQLIGLQEIVETKKSGHKMLSLHHSSIAKLYFGAYLRESDFGRRIKKNILNGKDKDDLEFCLFFRYLTITDLINAVDVVNSLRRDWWDKKRGKLLKRLIEEDKIQKSFKKGIDKEKDIRTVGSCVHHIACASKEVALKLIDNVSAKINKEKDIVKVGLCISDIAGASKEVALKLIDSVSVKIIKEKDIVKIRSCVSDIARAREELALKLVDSISAKIDQEKYIEMVGWWISWIVQASKELALKLVDSISAKIDKEKDIEKVGWCVLDIASANKEIALKLVEKIDIDALSSKINEEEDIRKVAWCVSGITSANEEIAMELIEKIDINALSSKINEEDIRKVGLCIYSIKRINEEVAREIVECLNPKLRIELHKEFI